MSNYTRYLLASAGINATKEDIVSIDASGCPEAVVGLLAQFHHEAMREKAWSIGEQVEWLTRPIPGGYLHGIVIKVGSRKVGIAVQSPKTGEWKPKWAEPAYLVKVDGGEHEHLR